jgi:hypothetical protein
VIETNLSFFDTLWVTLLQFQWMVILAVPLGLLFLFLGYKLTAEVEWTQRRLKVLGVLYNLTTREQLLVAAGFLRVLFAAMVAGFGVYMQPAHTVFFVSLFLLIAVLDRSLKRFIFDFVNSCVVYVALVVSNLLAGFYRDVTGGRAMLAVCVLLGLFVLLYVAYFYLKGIYDMLREKNDGLTQPTLEELERAE